MIPANLIRIGILSRPHGIGGTMILRFSGNFEDELKEREFLFVSIDGTMIPFFMEEVQVAGDSAYVKFSDIDSQEKTELLKSKVAYIPSRTKASPPDLKTLEGFTARDENSGREGTISALYENGENPLFLLKIDEEEYLIPANTELIRSIDRKGRFLILDLPDGIFGLSE